MPQNPLRRQASRSGVIYNTSMSRPDAALALAALYGFEGKRESRIGAVCVTGAGLNTAIFCDIVARFYQLGPPRNANQSLPVGLAAVDPLPPDSPMVRRRAWTTAIRSTRTPSRRLSDTSLAEAVLRNGVIFNADAVVILSAPATCLAKSLDLLGAQGAVQGAREAAGDRRTPARRSSDVAALRKVHRRVAHAVFYCGKEVGEALPFPGARDREGFRVVAPRIRWSTPIARSSRCPTTRPRGTCRRALRRASRFRLLQALRCRRAECRRRRPDALFRRWRKSPKPLCGPRQARQLIAALVELTSAKPVPPAQRLRHQSDASLVL